MLCIICIKTVDETRARARPTQTSQTMQGRGARLGTALANQ